ncbi:MAG TPA: hypothetical protein VE954_06210 [Oligoflexus sp.]|uniref:hypothetical protein n=1 Tax=Oligoflexus sp. TaxID=1971216 RepID=UPI002D6D2062|nr:hypothetical protein [Oligoflexus sp.]HYX32688.1 hypothetical protein [Oligoflexus sp.]
MRFMPRPGYWLLILVLIHTGCNKQNQNDRKSESLASSNIEPESDKTTDQLAAMHSGLKSCNSCHTKDRPAAPHDQQADCVGCHSFPAFKSTLNAALHEPTPASCNSCHEKNRPAAPHIANKDCVGCHAFPTFKRVAFSHLPKPAVCEECHARPATAGLRAYPNQGPPVGFLANDPKAMGSRHYVGKDCISCHRTPDEGATAFNFTHSTPRADFCLPCHFNEGRDEHAGDNRAVLLDFGNCASCHRNFDVNVNRGWGRGNN